MFANVMRDVNHSSVDDGRGVSNVRCRWVRACDVADESAADAYDPASVDTKNSTATLEKTSSGAHGVSYTSGDGRCSGRLVFTPSSGSRFWSLACVPIACLLRICCVHIVLCDEPHDAQ
jgi:hypothetical protein